MRYNNADYARAIVKRDAINFLFYRVIIYYINFFENCRLWTHLY